MTSDVDTVVRLTQGNSGKFNFRLKHDSYYGLGWQFYNCKGIYAIGKFSWKSRLVGKIYPRIGKLKAKLETTIKVGNSNIHLGNEQLSIEIFQA